jgi:hypothetical protein
MDQVLHRLFGATDVLGCVLDCEKSRGRFGSPVSIVNLRKDLCRELRSKLGYEEFVEHCCPVVHCRILYRYKEIQLYVCIFRAAVQP